jgi:uncharacterized oligopeptide transporter (OPT) family protein
VDFIRFSNCAQAYAEGIKEAIAGIKGGKVSAKKRIDQDLNIKFVFLSNRCPYYTNIFLVYGYISNEWAVSGIMAVFAILFAFIASAIAGYMAGLLGSPLIILISGVTVSVLINYLFNSSRIWPFRRCWCLRHSNFNCCNYLLCSSNLWRCASIYDLWSDDWRNT